MGGEWRSSTWGEEISLEYGKALRDYEDSSGKYRVFGANGPVGWTNQPLAPGPGVILGRKGAYRGVQYSPEPFFVIDTAYYVVPKTKLDMRWLYYAIKHYKLGEVDDGSPIPSTTRAAVYMLDLDIPRFPEQRAIAHILGTLDDKIELNQRMNETLEAMARALFKSWFVDFDPVRAKAKGRDSGLPMHIADLFPDSFEDSELGEIPKGWEVGRLGDLVGFLSGYAFKSRDWTDEGIPVVKIGSVKPGLVDLEEVSYVSDEVAEQASRFRLSSGDLLVGMTGYVGEVGLIPPTKNPPLLNQRVGKFILEKSGTKALGYIYCLTRGPEFKAAVERKSHGTAQANVSAEAILSIPLVLPPKVQRDYFNGICQPLLERILCNYGEQHTLIVLRDTLLPKLISGELRVKDAERFIERAV